MQSLENNKKYKEEKKLKLLQAKREKLYEKTRIASSSIVANKVKKVSQWVSIGKKKNTGEKNVFKEIRNERPHYCTICNKYITEAQARCFAHLLAKGMYPKYRLNKDNIALVCSVFCHLYLDSLCVWIKQLIKNKIDKWEKITKEWILYQKSIDL